MPHTHHSPTHYEILGIPRNAPQDAIHPAYRQMAKKFHPSSTFQGSTPNAKMFIAIQVALEILGNVKSRDRYNETLPPEKAESASGAAGTTETTTATGTTDTASSAGTKSSTTGSRSGHSDVHRAPYPKGESARKREKEKRAAHSKSSWGSYSERRWRPLTHSSVPAPSKYEPLRRLHIAPMSNHVVRPAAPRPRRNLRMELRL